MGEIYTLKCFILAQENLYDTALFEIQKGKKFSHWMWYIFPQIDGLGLSSTSIKYSIESLDEAKVYIENPILGSRLNEIANTLFDIEGKTALEIFVFPDDIKLKSSMTLFEAVFLDKNNIFKKVLDKYFKGEADQKTIDLILSFSKVGK